MPNESVHNVLLQAFQHIPLVDRLSSLDPAFFEDLGSIAATDPRVPGLTSQMQASWPTTGQIEGILQLYECLATTLSQMIKSRPDLADDSPVAKGLDEAAERGNTPLSVIDDQLLSFRRVFAWLRRVQPGASNALRVALVRAPDVNRVFDTDGNIVVDDFAGSFGHASTGLSGQVQSRVWQWVSLEL